MDSFYSVVQLHFTIGQYIIFSEITSFKASEHLFNIFPSYICFVNSRYFIAVTIRKYLHPQLV